MDGFMLYSLSRLWAIITKMKNKKKGQEPVLSFDDTPGKALNKRFGFGEWTDRHQIQKKSNRLS
jgi:hypothetical protein